MPETLTLYTAKICPYAHRTELALEEAHADYTRYEIDLSNKPEWYAPRVNPASKVPAIAYGGPKTAPDQPSPESEKIAESLVLLEFIADLYPESNLLPKDPVLRAKARFFIDAFSTKVSPFYMAFVARGEPFDNLLKGIEALQSLLPPEDKGPFALGSQFSIADAAVLPFIARLYIILKNDIGGFAKGVGPASFKILQEDEKYKRFKSYVEALFERESFKKTFHEDVIAEVYQKRFGRQE